MYCATKVALQKIEVSYLHPCLIEINCQMFIVIYNKVYIFYTVLFYFFSLFFYRKHPMLVGIQAIRSQGT